jgi:hypothetical protein
VGFRISNLRRRNKNSHWKCSFSIARHKILDSIPSPEEEGGGGRGGGGGRRKRKKVMGRKQDKHKTRSFLVHGQRHCLPLQKLSQRA